MNQAAVDSPSVGRSAGPTRTFRGTFATAAVLAVALAVLGIGAWLDPNPDGVGTHTQLGLASCSFMTFTGVPCAACGMTTAVSHAAHGRPLEAFIIQPAGALFALAMAVTALVCAYSLIRVVPLAPLGLALLKPKPIGVIVAIVLAAWIYKVIVVAGHH